MYKAVWKDTIIAKSDKTIEIEHNQYFPPDSVKWEHLRPSLATSVCPWKGLAHYYDVTLGDDMSKDAAWTYPEPKAAALQIKDYVAFWQDVKVIAE